MEPSCSLTVWISHSKHAFVLQIRNERVLVFPVDFFRVIWKEFVLISKETLNSSSAGRKTQVDFWLNMADLIYIFTPSQNTNEMIGSGGKVEIHKDK